MGKYTHVPVEPPGGGKLISRASAERPGHLHYTIKRNWFRDYDVERRRHGHDYFIPIEQINWSNQPYPQNQPTAPQTNEPINLIHLCRAANGETAVCSGVPSSLYVFYPWGVRPSRFMEAAATPDDVFFEGDVFDPEKWMDLYGPGSLPSISWGDWGFPYGSGDDFASAGYPGSAPPWTPPGGGGPSVPPGGSGGGGGNTGGNTGDDSGGTGGDPLNPPPDEHETDTVTICSGFCVRTCDLFTAAQLAQMQAGGKLGVDTNSSNKYVQAAWAIFTAEVNNYLSALGKTPLEPPAPYWGYLEPGGTMYQIKEWVDSNGQVLVKNPVGTQPAIFICRQFTFYI